MERGEIEQPYRPSLRVAMAVFDQNDSKIGLIVVNVYIKEFLDYLKSLSKTFTGDFYVVNPQGYFVMAPSPSQEWGFQLKRRESQNIQNYLPTRKDIFLVRKSGQILEEGRVYTWDTIFTQDSKQTLRENQRQWKVLNVSTEEELMPALLLSKKIFYKISLIVVGLIVLISYFLARFSFQREFAKKRMDAVFKSIDNAVFITDIEANILDVNRSACQMFEYDKEELVGKNASILMSKDLQEVHHTKVTNFDLKQKNTIVGKERNIEAVTKSGKTMAVEIIVNAIHVLGLDYFVGEIRDLTDMRKLKSEISELDDRFHVNIQFSKNFSEISKREIDDVVKIISAIVRKRRSCQQGESNEEMGFIDGLVESFRDLMKNILDLSANQTLSPAAPDVFDIEDFMREFSNYFSANLEAIKLTVTFQPYDRKFCKIKLSKTLLKQILLLILGGLFKSDWSRDLNINCLLRDNRAHPDKLDVQLTFNVQNVASGDISDFNVAHKLTNFIGGRLRAPQITEQSVALRLEINGIEKGYEKI